MPVQKMVATPAHHGAHTKFTIMVNTKIGHTVSSIHTADVFQNAAETFVLVEYLV